MSVSSERLDAIQSKIDAAAEDLADLALDLLHQALGDADPKASPAARDEKLVTRARRSLDKASGLLRGLETSD
jgi:hypothetical protein